MISVGNCTLKQWDTKGKKIKENKTLLECPKCLTLILRNVGEDVEQRNSHHCCWECKMIWPLWRTVWQFIKVNVLLHLIQESCSFVFTQMLLKLTGFRVIRIRSKPNWQCGALIVTHHISASVFTYAKDTSFFWNIFITKIIQMKI